MNEHERRVLSEQYDATIEAISQHHAMLGIIDALLAASEPGDETAAPIQLLEACDAFIRALGSPFEHNRCQYCGAKVGNIGNKHDLHCAWLAFRQAVEEAHKAAEPANGTLR